MIETVKRGWSDRLPEYDYLASILSQVERKQKLTLGMVKPAHPVPVVQLLKVTSSQHRIHLGKIDVFTGEEQYGFTEHIRLGQLVIKRMQLNHVQLKS